MSVILDQRCSKYSTGQKSRKWTKKVLAFLLDVARTNGQTIWAINMGVDPRSVKSQEFLWYLILQMVTPHIQRRKISATFKHNSTITKSTLEHFLLTTKSDRAQCQVGQYLQMERVSAFENLIVTKLFSFISERTNFQKQVNSSQFVISFKFSFTVAPWAYKDKKFVSL